MTLLEYGDVLQLDNSSGEENSTTLAKQNFMLEGIKRELNSGNTCYNSVQNFLSSSLLSKNLKIKIQLTIILPVVVCGCETWSLRRNVG